MSNAVLAEQVLTFAEGGDFFRPVSEFTGRFPHRVVDFREALSVSRAEEAFLLRDTYSPLHASFVQQETRVRDVIYARPDWREFSALETEAFARLEKAVRLIPPGFKDASDDVLAHLSVCWLSRRTLGHDPFFERIFEAYQFGLWPCGWTDTHDQHDILVFVNTGAPRIKDT